MKRLRILRVLAALVCATGAVAGSTVAYTHSAYKSHHTQAHAAKKFRIGFSNGFSGNTWRTEMLASLNQEYKRRHMEISQLIVLDGEGSISKQIGDVQSLIAQRVDALLTIPNSGTALAPAVAKATQRGIVTVPFNLPLSGSDYTAYVGTDPANKGARLARFMVQRLHGHGKIVALGGIPGNSYTAAAWGAAKKVFQHSHIQILAYRDAYWQEDRAKTVTADLLATYPHIDGVWCDGGQDCAGAVKAFLATGRPLPVVTGDDYNGLIKLYLRYRHKYPEFDIGLLSEPTWESRVALDVALKALEHKPYRKITILHPKLITGRNAARYVKWDLPDGVFVDTDLPDSVLKKLFH
jgi:ribose transport system substrate-binding protein